MLFCRADILVPSDRRSCCFTKAYAHYAEGTGSVLQTNLARKVLQLRICTFFDIVLRLLVFKDGDRGFCESLASGV